MGTAGSQQMATVDAVAADIAERVVKIDGLEIFCRDAVRPSDAPAGPPGTEAAPVLYIHGVPTHGADWLPFLARTGGVAIDLPGFGRSSKPAPADFSYSITGYDDVLGKLPDALGFDRFSLVVHDWGALALYTASQLADRIERLVVINAVPLLPGYRWHRIARLWRTPIVGELAMGFTTKFVAKRLMREASATGALTSEYLDMFWKQFNFETQRAILKLYRHADPDVLEEAGADLGRIDAPALVAWGEQDPYIPADFAQAYADAFPNGAVRLYPNASHWAWIDDPTVIDEVTDFLLTGNTP